MLRRVVVLLELAGRLLLVEGRDLAHADALEDLEAALHLGDRPLQGARRLLGLRDDGHVEVRQAVVGRELDALGVDHDEADVFGEGAHEQAHEDGGDDDGLARARGAGDEQVRHLGEVGDHGLALGIAAERELERPARHVGQDVAEGDGLARAVGDLDAHVRGAGDGREDAHGVRGEREGDVVLEARDAAHALALARLDLERRDRGAGDPPDDAGVEAELLKRCLQRFCCLLKLGVRR